jgi:hypothetical protein
LARFALTSLAALTVRLGEAFFFFAALAIG